MIQEFQCLIFQYLWRDSVYVCVPKSFSLPTVSFSIFDKDFVRWLSNSFQSQNRIGYNKTQNTFWKNKLFPEFSVAFFMFFIRYSVSISEKLFDPLSAFLSVSSAPLKMLNQCWQIENDWKTHILSSSVIINDGDDSHLHIVIIVSFVAIFIATLISAISFFITTIMIAIFPSTVPSRSRLSFCFVF